jgi:hypothetical protein
MTPLETLLAIEEIRQLKARYFRCVDTKDWDGFASVFTDDVVLDRTYGSSIRNPWTGEWNPPLAQEPQLVRGRDEVMATVRGVVANLQTVHHGHMPEIAFVDARNANGIWAMEDELRDREGRLIVIGKGHYHEAYRMTDDGWRIASFRLTRLSLDRGDGTRD